MHSFEIDHLKKIRVFHYSELLCVDDENAMAEVYFKLWGLIIHAVTHGNDKPTNDLCLYTANSTVDYGNSSLFLSFQQGDTFLALDAPFMARMDPGENLVMDAAMGIKIVYVLKFVIEEEAGMKLLNAGAAFHQHLDASRHTTLLHICSAILGPKIAKFAGQIAHTQVAAGPSSSSDSASGFALIQDR